jgi:predicted helicase
MATGTGKTYTAFQIIWRLWKAGSKKRILFLANRRPRSQFLPESGRCRLMAIKGSADPGYFA